MTTSPADPILARIAAGQRAVLAQTERLHRGFGQTTSDWKSDGTRVTPVDLAISEGIIGQLKKQFSDDDFFSEELTQAAAPVPLTQRFAWVLDPIDGTNNYAMGLAHCAISLALLEHRSSDLWDSLRSCPAHSHAGWAGLRVVRWRSAGACPDGSAACANVDRISQSLQPNLCAPRAGPRREL